MQRRTFIGGLAALLVCAGGAFIAGFPLYKPFIRKRLFSHDINKTSGTLTEEQIASLSTFAGALANDYEPEIIEDLRPWLMHHAGNVPGWFDLYTRGTQYLDDMAHLHGRNAFSALHPHEAKEITNLIIEETDSALSLITAATRQRWEMQQKLIENLRKGWSLSNRPWIVVGYGNLIPGTLPGARAYTEPPELTPLPRISA